MKSAMRNDGLVSEDGNRNPNQKIGNRGLIFFSLSGKVFIIELSRIPDKLPACPDNGFFNMGESVQEVLTERFPSKATDIRGLSALGTIV
jgi:hypothetical protein